MAELSESSDILLGAHMSIAGGLHLAVERGTELGCSVIQMFTKNASRWSEKTVEASLSSLFKEALKKHSMRLAFAHGGYLINLATADDSLREKSIRAMAEEIKRCEALGLPFVVIHPGSHGGSGVKLGLKRIVSSLREIMEMTVGGTVRILLENTAGQGNVLGYSFEQLAYLLSETGLPDRLGICFDTAHAFAAGYDLRAPASFRRTMKELDEVIGLNKVFAVHLNDSRRRLGSRIDRHEHIGEGSLGLYPFREIMRNEAFRNVPKVLETPKYKGSIPMDPVNLAMLRQLAIKKGGK